MPSDDLSAGPVDPRFGLADFSRQALCPLGRESLRIAHLQHRMGLALALFGEAEQRRTLRP